MATLTLTGSNANTLTGTNVSGGTVATTGDDTISATSAQISGSTLDGNGGTDVLQLTGGGAFNLKAAALLNVTSIKLMSSSTVTGTTGADLISGSGAEDTLIGDAGNDTLHGDAHHDTLSGGDGNDTLSGGAGNDLLAGGEGNDVFALAAADIAGFADTLSGGNGTDAVVLGGAGIYDFSAVEIHGVEQVSGSSGNDGISGLADAGTPTAAFLVDGGGGNDTLAGGAGNDTLSGGSGNDVFAFASTGNGTDRIADIAENEIIRVTGRASTGGTVTDGNGSNVAANSVQVSTSGGVTTLYIDTNGTAGAAELTVTLTGTFAARNFTLSGTDITHVVPPIFSTGTDNYTDDLGNALTAAAATGTINAGDTVDAGDGTDTLNATLANGETTGPATLTGWENLNLTVASGATATFDAQNVSASTLKPVGAGAHVITNASVSVDASGLTGAGTLNATFTGGNVTATGGAGRDTLSGGTGADTLSGAAGNDLLYGGAGNDVFGYAATDAGQVDVIGDFAAGDVIRVGSATLGGITSGTGTGLAARGVQVGAASGGFTPLYVDLDGNGGAADLTINLAGSFTASGLQVTSNEISVYTPPPSTGGGGGGGGDSGGGGTAQTVDGVTVQQTTQTASDGTRTETLTVPIVRAGRTEQNAATPSADIPLARDSGGQELLTAHVPVGVGLTVESTTTTASGVQGLIRAIQNRTQNQPGDQSAMTGVGQSFLDVLPPATNLTVRTIVPVVANPAAPPSQPIVITGTAPAAGSTQQQAVVIDASSLPSGTVIQLQNVDFAAVVGAVRVTGGEGSQVVAGDSADQWMVLGADDDTLRGGGGNDFVGSEGGDDVLFGDTGLDTVTGGVGNDALYGNQQDDVVYGNQGRDTLFGGQDADTVFGGQDGDVLYGNRAADVLYGQLGSDTLFGGQDNDVLFGDQGDDLLAGNLGSDTLTGGQGADVFRIGAPQEGGDVITDFEAGTDKIAVAGPNFGNIPAGSLSASHFALDNPTSAGATFVFNTRTGVLSFDADGSGAGAAVTVATLNVRTLSHTDILVVPN